MKTRWRVFDCNEDQCLAAHETGSTPSCRVRARTLAENSGNLVQFVLQGFGIWRSVFVSGDHHGPVALADRILDLAQREGSDASLAFAYRP